MSKKFSLPDFVDSFSNGMYDSDQFDKFVRSYHLLKNRYPEFEIIHKESSRFMVFLSYLLFFNRGFMSDYITTIGYKVYVPTDRINPSLWVTLLHEGQHMRQNSSSFVFPFLYLFPQVLAILSFLSLVALFGSGLWLLNLLWLLCLLPIPSYFRMIYESEAYLINILSGRASSFDLIDHFIGPDYYFMWPFRRYLVNRFTYLLSNQDSILDRAILDILRSGR